MTWSLYLCCSLHSEHARTQDNFCEWLRNVFASVVSACKNENSMCWKLLKTQNTPLCQQAKDAQQQEVDSDIPHLTGVHLAAKSGSWLNPGLVLLLSLLLSPPLNVECENIWLSSIPSQTPLERYFSCMSIFRMMRFRLVCCSCKFVWPLTAACLTATTTNKDHLTKNA